MRKRRNKFDSEKFDAAKSTLVDMFPGIAKKAFFVSGIKQSGLFTPDMTAVTASAVCELAGDSLTLRTYRRPNPGSGTRFKIDEVHAVDKRVVSLPAHKDIHNHYIQHDIPEDMMNRNQMTFEFVPDGNGGIKPNTQPDGMLKVYINFPDPIEELKKRMAARYGTSMPRPQDRP